MRSRRVDGLSVRLSSDLLNGQSHLPATGAAAADEEEKQQRLLAGLPILTHTRANRK